MCVIGMSMPDFDNQTLAALRGRMVRYLMRSREVSTAEKTEIFNLLKENAKKGLICVDAFSQYS